MSHLQNITFGDRDTTHLQYSGNWFLTGSYNASSVGQTGTLSSTSDQNAKVTFAFPQPVVAFYYYGIPRCCGGMYGICIDCDPNNPNYITIDAVNRTDDGHNPPVVLFSKTFDTLGMHEIIIANQNDPRFGKSQLTIASIVLEVDGSTDGGTSSGTTTTKAPASGTTVTPNPGSSGSASLSLGASASAGFSVSGSSTLPSGTGTSIATKGSPTSPSSASSSSSSSSSTAGTALDGTNSSSSSHHTPLGAIIGGVLAALAFLLFIIILAFCIRLRRRRAAEALASSDHNTDNNRSIPAPSSAIQPFNNPQSQSPFMTASETATPASSGTPVSRGYGMGKHYRPPPGASAGVSVSTFSDATGLSSSSAPTGASAGGNGSGTGSGRRRELDGGPVYSPVLAEEEDTLPPDYMDVFASRRNTANNMAQVRSLTPSTNRAMSDTSSSARGGGGGSSGISDLSPMRRKS